MKKLFAKLLNRETILYLIFGVLSTIVNYVVFWLMNLLLGEDLALFNNAVAFVAAVTFAYITNKLFVFESKSWSVAILRHEIPTFLGARLFSFGIEELLLWISKDVIHVSRYEVLGVGGLMVAKILISVVVVILNYVFSKLIVFKKK